MHCVTARSRLQHIAVTQAAQPQGKCAILKLSYLHRDDSQKK